MLLRLTIKNFLSFYEETTFDMFANPKRTTFQNHVYSDLPVPLLKQAAIYGANGSGKSNFIDAIKLIKEITTTSDFLNNYPIGRNKFLLAQSENNEPICFSIEFLIEGKVFIYNLQFDGDKIILEELLLSGIGKKNNESVFVRTGNRIVSKYSNKSKEIEDAAKKILKENRFSSIIFLSEKFPFFKDSKLINSASKWFKEYLVVLSFRRQFPGLIDVFSKKPEMFEFAKNVFRDIGIGINDIEIAESNLNEILSDNNEQTKTLKETIINRLDKTGGFSQLQHEKVLFTFEKKDNGEQFVKRLLFKHVGINGYEAKMEMECQSEGTAKILNLIPAFYRIENEPVVFFIDELENSIHPLLMTNLISRFSYAKTKGQLIYTTHETQLLNQQEIMRPDEVWFTEKHEGATKMYSLNDFKIHNTINIQNGYLIGRFGGIPFIGNQDLLNDK